ncbi:MAG: MoaD/ThiS family protein, partial [Candidatus Bathyarchaeia archaeon]
TVRFMGAFRHLSSRSKLTLKIKKGALLKEVIKEIAEEAPKLKRALIDPELEDPRPNTLILVNGKEISILNGLETRLSDGDEVVFIPVVHGG